MKIEIIIPDEHIDSALSGPHSRYWAREASWDPKTRTGWVIEDYDMPEGVRHELNDEKIARAIQLMVGGNCPAVLQRLITNSCDGVDGDALLQLAAIGELRYG